jgi:hypothetical protein
MRLFVSDNKMIFELEYFLIFLNFKHISLTHYYQCYPIKKLKYFEFMIYLSFC